MPTTFSLNRPIWLHFLKLDQLRNERQLQRTEKKPKWGMPFRMRGKK